MKGSDKLEMTVEIGGESIKLGDIDFNDQINVRDTERSIKVFINQLKKKWPDKSEKNLLAMTAYQYARWYHQLLQIHNEAIEITNAKIQQIENLKTHGEPDSSGSLMI